jgi:hypothetical protein
MGRLLKHVSGTAGFKNPTTGQRVEGHIIDEAWVCEPEEFSEIAPDRGDGWFEGAFVAQLVDWGGGNLRVRFAYYPRRPGRGPKGWVFAQFAPSMSLEECQILFQKIQEKGWLVRPGATTDV